MTRTKNSHKYTKEEIEFVRENASKYYVPQLVEMFNKKFKTNISLTKMKSLKNRNNIKSGLVRNPNADPDPTKWNTKHNQVRRTGKTREQWLEEVKHKTGYEYIGKDGRRYIKIKEEVGSNTNYMTKARYNYIKKYGEIPEGYVLLHIDGDRLNDNLKNLVLVHKCQIYMANRSKSLTKNKDINETIVLATRLKQKALHKRKEWLEIINKM